ncbi:MAG: ABC transporter permease [Gemmataceae bacterium]|nr:ABC transporter permease [Gemmataceae bacterium]
MTFIALLLRNLRYHWRGNLAVFLGVALGAAVLTGALFVGDSLRGSLKELTLDQLGWVEQALVPGRSFRARLADALGAERAAPVLMLQGSAATSDDKKPKTVPKVNVLGVDERFWQDETSRQAASWNGGEDAVVLNRTLAAALGAQVGDRLTFNVQKSEAAPRETLLGKRDDVVQSVRVTVSAIVPDRGMARFTLRPSPEPVRNAFVPLRFLQKELQQDGKANAVFARSIRNKLQDTLTLDDWNLKLRTPADRARDFVRFLDPRNEDGVLRKSQWEGRVPESLAKAADKQGNLTVAAVIQYFEKHRPYISVESEQMFLDAATEKALVGVARSKMKSDPPTPLIYLADRISDGAAEMPYAVIAAVQPEHLPVAKPARLADDEIALVVWPGMPLAANVGDELTVNYYVPDETSKLQLRSATLRVGLLIPMEGPADDPADDPDWTPEFRGITDRLSISQWENPPFPYDPKRIKPIDEQYWKRFRAAPKAYLTLATGQRLWANRFGKITSVRFPHPWPYLGKDILKRLPAEAGGFVIQDVRALATRASSGSTDFGVLFLAFSFFLIAAALLLVGLLFRLNLDRRAAEIGLLLATGWRHGRVRWLLLAEGAALAIVAAAVGLLGALLYGDLMLRMLAANWPGGANLAFLRLHAAPISYVIGYSASVAMSVLTIVWATRILGKLSPRSLLAGETTAGANVFTQSSQLSRFVLIGALVGAAGCLVGGVVATGHTAKAGSFFGAGALLLTAALTFVWRWLHEHGAAKTPQPSLTRLGARNAGRHPVRSVLTVGLLASATFLITAVEAFHKETGPEFFGKRGGSGGFTLIAETDVPIFQDLNDPKTQANWDLTDEGASALRAAKFYALRVRHGDDASCLNLYQPLKPRIAGVPAGLRREGRFRFAGTIAEKTKPWDLLEPDLLESSRAANAIPALLDANTAQWILKKSLGDDLEITDDSGEKRTLRVVGLLQESIFQSEVLIAEEDFLRLFPRREGFQLFLIETDPAQAEAVKKALENALADQGIQAESTAQRLQSFLAIENMYLETFKALGGLGLLLGAAGLAIVLLRGVWERRGELALLRALGFRGAQLAWLVLAENALLVALGLAAGTIAALLAVAPHLASSGAAPLWGRLAGLLLLVVAVGLLSGAAAVWGSLRTPLLTALRRE